MSARPLLLDLFYGAGGAAMGYHRAGFDVLGVDVNPQPRYPFSFVQADALEYLRAMGPFAAVHASPPCQAYSLARNNGSGAWAPKLIAPVRELLDAQGGLYVIENVEGARKEMRNPHLICGAYFGLSIAGMDLSRHRLFEANFPLDTPPCSHRKGNTVGVYGHGTNQWHRRKLGRNIYEREKRAGMGIDWMNRGELAESIPPVYTELVGRQFLEALLPRLSFA